MQPDGPLTHLRVDREPDGRTGVVVVTLDLPQRRNAMSEEMTRSWQRVMAALREDAELRAVVVTGAGSAFCAGGDLEWIAGDLGATVAALRERMLAFYRAWLSVGELEVPTIAAVNGAAVGAGLAVALACDLRYVSIEASLSAPFTALGLHPGMGTTWLLPEVAGLPVAREMLLAGRVVHGHEAVALGLANRAFPQGRLLPEALDVASAIAARAPIATRLTKVALVAGGHASAEAALRWEGLAQPATMVSADLAEGIAAARERRTPRFRGR